MKKDIEPIVDPVDEPTVLAPETVTVTNLVTDPTTGEVSDDTQVDITPQVVSADTLSTTLGNLKMSLNSLQTLRDTTDTQYQKSVEYIDCQIKSTQNQIDQIG